MTNRLGVVLTLLGVALLVTSSVSVSTVALERSVTIEVTDSPPVEFDPDTPIVDENESEIALFNVTNEAGTPITVTDVEEAGETSMIGTVDRGGEIDAGETATVTADTSCTDGAEELVPIDVTVSGDGITIERTIEVSIDCSD